jgi:selenocysteine lyase/cysteine desulfurase
VNKKALFSRFLAADPERLHFAAHSHHYWPDVTFEAQQRAWLDAAALADEKWDAISREVMPRARAHVARILGLPDPGTVAFGPNTHGFLVRILSSLDPRRPARVLTTDGEFHSASRQLARLEEDGLAEVVRVATRPFASFPSRWADAASRGGFDLAYFSHVFFDSGWAVPSLEAMVGAVVDPRTVVVVDGYHGFCALPTDLSRVAARAFYLAGGYKYAMSGEGCCFVHAPDGWAPRPRDTGWFASFAAIAERPTGRVPYAAGGARMMGATFDPTALYRFNAAMDLLVAESLGVADVHAHVHALQRRFVDELARRPGHPLRQEALLVPVADEHRGHFLAWSLPDAAEVHRRLLGAKLVTDVRGDRLRLGFGLYHDEDDVVRGAERVARVFRS